MDPNRYCWLYLIITLMDEARKIMTMNLSIIVRQDQDPDDDFVHCHDVCFLTSLIFLLFFPTRFQSYGKISKKSDDLWSLLWWHRWGKTPLRDAMCIRPLRVLWGPVRWVDFIFFFSWLVVDLLNKRRKEFPKFLSLSGLALLWSHFFPPKYEFVVILEVLLEIFPPIHDSFI